MTAHSISNVVPGPDGLNRRAFSADDVRRMTEAGKQGYSETVTFGEDDAISPSAAALAGIAVRLSDLL